MNANPKFLSATAHVDEAAVKPLPNSRKVYVAGSRPDIRVPMREIRQSDTPLHSGAAAQGGAAARSEPNPPIFVYDTSGPYTDPTVKIDIRRGLAPLRQQWIVERSDTEELAGPTSRYGRERLADPKLAQLRFDLKRKPRRAMARTERDADALRAPRHDHAGDGVHRDPREPAHGRPLGAPAPAAPGAVLWRRDPEGDHAGVRARRGCARARHHSRQHQSSGNRADDHRPQFPGEDQRQHRQFRGLLGHPGGGREDDVGDPLGRRHGDGPLHRQAHPRDAGMDHPQFAGADRHGADLPGAGEGRRAGRRS